MIPFRLLPFLVASILLASCEFQRHDTGPVIGDWKMCIQETSDTGKFPREGSWRTLDRPEYQYIPKSGGIEHRVVWYSGTFWADAGRGRYHGLVTGRIRYFDRVYVNGTLVGSGGIEKTCLMPFPRHYSFPENCGRELIVSGKNTIIIGIEGPGNDYVGLAGGASVLPEDEFERTVFADDLAYRIFPAGIIILFTSSALSLLVLYFLNRRDRLVMISLVADLCLAAYITTRFIPLGALDPCYLAPLHWSGTMIFSAIIILMTQAVYRVYFSRMNLVVVPLVAAVGLLGFPLLFKSSGAVPLAIISFASFAASMVFSAYVDRRFRGVMRDPAKAVIYWCIIAVVSVIIISDIIIRSAGLAPADLVVIYGSPAAILLFHALLGRDYIVKTMDLERLYGSLREKEMKSVVPVSETAAEKLERVIEFIRQNYNSDIAREGLAAAVDMNHNYMSRIFKTYTGMKISEYITDLRIKEAGRLLKDSDMKIIDIALSVGFESLTTFNRSFRIVMGLSPAGYRKKHQGKGRVQE